MDDGGAAGVDERFLGHQASQRFGADLLNQQKGKLRSGDDDLSAPLPLSQRRAKFDGVKAKQAARWGFLQLLCNSCCGHVLAKLSIIVTQQVLAHGRSGRAAGLKAAPVKWAMVASSVVF